MSELSLAFSMAPTDAAPLVSTNGVALVDAADRVADWAAEEVAEDVAEEVAEDVAEEVAGEVAGEVAEGRPGRIEGPRAPPLLLASGGWPWAVHPARA
jgi:hypothetical protein